MNSATIEALYIFDELHNPILAHTYNARPLAAAQLLPLFLAHPPPRPSLVYLSHTAPPTLVFSLRTEADLLLLATASAEVEPLLVLEFLHRVVDALEDFLGAPLLAARVEGSYDVVAQLLTEMCDAGLVGTTEPNALRDVVEVEGWMGKLLGNLNLPGKQLNQNQQPPSLMPPNTPALPWRQSNVRHTSNEMYADIVESLSVTLAPSGRPLAAFANGTIAFTSKISGVPDISLTLTSPAGKQMAARMMDLPVFHPCVRLARWKESPGEMSFIPPDGRCVLAGYGVDLMPAADSPASSFKLPVSLEMRTGLGTTGSDFDVRVQVNRVFGSGGNSSGSRTGLGGGPHSGAANSPQLEELIISVPLPAEVRNLPDIRPSKGDASYNPGSQMLEWHVPAKVLATATHFNLRCTVLGPRPDDQDEEGRESADPTGFGFGLGYEEPYQSSSTLATDEKGGSSEGAAADKEKDEKRIRQNKILMPTSATVSFSVKGWLASGLKVESIMLNVRKSKGIGETVKPYKGVKYLTVSKRGVEIRCWC